MYAVIESGGKQYRVQVGERVQLERLTAAVNSEVTFPALLVANDENIQIGAPHLVNAQVKAKVLSEEKGEKLLIFKMKRRKGYRRKNGHRQIYTKLEITSITQ